VLGGVFVRIKSLLGTLAGFSIGFFLIGLWKGELDWSLWISILIGGTIGHSVIVFFRNHIKETSDHK